MLESCYNQSFMELDKTDCDAGVGRYSSTKVLLFEYLEHQERIHYGKALEGLILGGDVLEWPRAWEQNLLSTYVFQTLRS